MTCHALARRAAIDARRRFLSMTAAAKIVKLLFEKGPDLLLRYMAVHTKTTACPVDIVMVAIYTVFLRVVQVLK